MSGAPALRGVTVVVTRRPEDVRGLEARVAAAGGRALCVPMIHFAPPADPAPLAAARQRIGSYDWIVVTSRYAARALLGALPVPALARPRVAALGHSTAEVVRALGWPVDLDGGGAGADALAERLAASGQLAGTAVLYPCSSLARSRLPQTLGDAGADVQLVEAYQTLAPEPAVRAEIVRHLEAGPALLVFASPSAVQHTDAVLAARAGQGGQAPREVWAQLVVVSIGPTTSRALRSAGARHIFEAAVPDDDGLMAALVAAAESGLARAAIEKGAQE